MDIIKIGYCPTRRDVFSKEEAHKFNDKILNIVKGFAVEIVDLQGINDECLLFQDSDIDSVIEKFSNEKIDALFFPHCNFGSENRVAQVAKALNVPVLVWGPRDDAPLSDGIRTRDSQCGMFATGKVLRRHNVPFTYLTNSWVDGQEFKDGFSRFLRVVNVVKSLKNLNILQISTRPEPFCSVICNENELLEKFNVHLYPITLHDLKVKMEEVESEKGEDYLKTVEFIKTIDKGNNAEKISKVASLKVAMKLLAKQYRCRAVAIQCWTALQSIVGIMPCLANSILTDEGIPTVCETDIHGAITAIMMQAVGMGEKTPFFADVTVRHPTNDNAELLWHCGNFPYSLAKKNGQEHASASRYHDNHYGIAEWELQGGNLTIARFDGDHGNYTLFVGEGKAVEGPKNVGSYVWIEVENWPLWERKIVEGPYIHHVSGIYGNYGEILIEACKYIPFLKPDVATPSQEKLNERWLSK